jgi:hypothetical protein
MAHYRTIHSVHAHTLCVELDKVTQLRLIRTQCAISRALCLVSPIGSPWRVSGILHAYLKPLTQKVRRLNLILITHLYINSIDIYRLSYCLLRPSTSTVHSNITPTGNCYTRKANNSWVQQANNSRNETLQKRVINERPQRLLQKLKG